ncbi:MAG: NUDIX hydrolase [Microthrixaceae bacterium]
MRDPDGASHQRDVVRHPGAVSVLPLHDDGTVTLVRQYRVALDGDLLEIPAGKADVAGEAAADLARRELAEEVGLSAASCERLVGFFLSPGYTDEWQRRFWPPASPRYPPRPMGPRRTTWRCWPDLDEALDGTRCLPSTPRRRSPC